MMSQPKFALFFMGGEVQILTSDSKVAGWTRVNSIHIEDPEFSNVIVGFRQTVQAATNGQNLVSVFLSEPDIFVSEVSIRGRTKNAQQDHVNRTLARRTGDKAENIVAAFGEIAADNTASVVYAALDTLVAAQDFLNQYGLDAAYFTPRYVPEGFKKEPRLLDFVPSPMKLRPTTGNVVQRIYTGTIAAMVCATAVLLGSVPDQRLDFVENPSLPISVYSTRLANLDYQPQTIIDSLPYEQAMPSTSNFNVGKLRSRDLSVRNNIVLATLQDHPKDGPTVVLDAGSARYFPIEIGNYPYSGADQVSGVSLAIDGVFDLKSNSLTNVSGTKANLESHNIAPIVANVPDPKQLRRLDALLKHGLFVEIGDLKNLTMANSVEPLPIESEVMAEAR